MGTIISLLRRTADAVADLWRTTEELHERRAILNRPWLHDRMHWSCADGEAPCLHGHELPERPDDVPVTSQGWCPCPPTAQPWPTRSTGSSATPPH